MLNLFRISKKATILKDEDAFWRYADATQRFRRTSRGTASEEEERLDLKAATALKTLLEATVGPEEGSSPAQMQSWDWNDDRCRRVMILRSNFSPSLVPAIRNLLVGEFADFQVLVTIVESWEGPTWGHLKFSATELGIQRNVAQAYAIAA
jgi:hypothetical protein